MKKHPAFNVSDKVKLTAASATQHEGLSLILDPDRVYCVRDVFTRIGGGTWLGLTGVLCPGETPREEYWFDARSFEHVSEPASEQTSGHLSIRMDDLDDPKLRAEWLRRRDR